MHWNWRFDTYWSRFSFGIPSLIISFYLFLENSFISSDFASDPWFNSSHLYFWWSIPIPWDWAIFSTFTCSNFVISINKLTSSRLYITLEWASVPEKHAYLFKVGHQLLAEVDVRVTHLLDPRMEGLEKCHFNYIHHNVSHVWHDFGLFSKLNFQE